MARLLTQTLNLARPASSPSTTAASASLRGLATKVEIIEIDLTEEDASSSAHGSSPSVEVVGIRRLEEAIHGVMVRRAAPDWLPFVPGGSFWVPPLRRPHGVAEVMGRIAAAGCADGVAELVGGMAAAGGTEGVDGVVGGAVEIVELDAPMMEEQTLCFPTTRGWPSASFFVKGKSPHSRRKSRKGATQTDDEES